MLVDEIGRTIARADAPVVLVAEGCRADASCCPRAPTAADARWVIIVDPIDGTRGLMYQKRPAWILTGVAPTDPRRARWPTSSWPCRPRFRWSSSICRDELWAVRGPGRGGHARQPADRRASRSRLAPVAAGDDRARLCDDLALLSRASRRAGRDRRRAWSRRCWARRSPGKAQSFEDQYICERRPALRADGRARSVRRRSAAAVRAAAPGRRAALCCHPYDLCTELIARELRRGRSPTSGAAARTRRSTSPPTSSWVGYANEALQAVEPRRSRARADRMSERVSVQTRPDACRSRRRGVTLASRLVATGPTCRARAPGRLDVMGGIADYSGALVLQWPIREATAARVAFRRSQRSAHHVA